LNTTLTRRERERQVRKEEILEAAEKLFCLKGFDGTSMDDIARESQFTKRTVYQYFINKEDLFFAIILRITRIFDANLIDLIKEEANAIGKIRAITMAYFQLYKNRPDIFKLINFRPVNDPNKELSPYYHEILKRQNDSYQMVMEIIDEGKIDGSISPDLDTRKAAHFATITLTSFMNTITRSNDQYFETNNFEKDDFILTGLDLLARSLCCKSESGLAFTYRPAKSLHL